MGDLLPKTETDLIPTGGLVFADKQSPATTNYLAQLAAAATSTFQDLNFPGDESQLKAIVESKDGEKNLRSSLASREVQEKNLNINWMLNDAIIGGANRKQVEDILAGKKDDQTAIQESEQSILERRAAKWLVDQGIADPSRAANVFNEEFIQNSPNSDTDRREDLAATMFKLNNIRNKIVDKYKDRGITEDIADMATMMLVPGHTTNSEANVFGRGAELLSTSVKNFSDKFWASNLQERLRILDQFEKDLDNNTGFRATGGKSQNIFSALDQIEQLITGGSALELNATEALDALVIPSGLYRAFKAFRNMSKAAQIAGAPEVAIDRTLKLDLKAKTNQYLTPAEEDELISNILPSIADMDQVPIQTSKLAESSPWAPGMAAEARRNGLEVQDVNPTVDLSTRVPSLGEPKPGTIRYYHGSVSEDSLDFTGKTFITPHWQYAKDYHGNNNNVFYIDIPITEAIEKGLYDTINRIPINGSIDDGANRLKKMPSGGMIIGETITPTGPASRYLGPVEKPAGPVNSSVEKTTIFEEMGRLVPELVADAKRKGVELSDINFEDFKPSDLIEVLHNTPLPNVLSPIEQDVANKAAVASLMKDYDLNIDVQAIVNPEKFTGGKVSINDMPVYDVNIDNISGIRTVNVYLGTGENRLQGYPSQISAEMGAKRMGLPDNFYTISEESGKWYIKVSKDVGGKKYISMIDKDELHPLWSFLAKYVAGSASTSTADMLQGARLSVNASSKLAQSAMKSVDKITKLGGESRKIYGDLMLDIQQKEKWYNIGQVKSWYVENHNRLPTEKELDAYRATRQLYEFDYIIRNAKIRQELVHNGYEEIRIRGLNKGAVIGKEVGTTSVDPNLLRIYDHGEGDFKIFKNREELSRRLSKDGSVLVKMLKPTTSYGEYVITPASNLSKKALRGEVLNKVDGPHRMYEGDWFIKQQRIVTLRGQEVLQNARTHFAIKGYKDAKKFADDYNEALKAYEYALTSGTPQSVFRATLTIAKNTRYSGFDEFDKAIKAGKIERTPFEIVKDGELPKHRLEDLSSSSAIDPEFNNFTDDLKSMIENNRMFYSQRGPRLPHPKEGLATLVHPNEILSQAIGNVINTQAYNNFRMRQIERWVKTYDKYLVGDPNRPAVEKFMYGQFDDAKNARFPFSAIERGTAEAQRENIKRTLNTPTMLDATVQRYRDQVIDLVDKNSNAKWADRFADITSNNVIAAARGIAFKFYLGFLDISQLIVQLSMFPGIVAVSPVNGFRALSSLPLIRAALLKNDDKLIAHLAKLNHKLTVGQVKPDTFIQLVKDIKRSGIDIIDANIGELDNMNNMANIRGAVATRFEKLTNGLSIFYNEAEKANRLLGFTVSWMDNFSKTGKGLDTAEEFASVGVRGNALAMNMARDGKAWWQEGAMSLPLQFQGHPFRVLEILLGPVNQMGLSNKDKLRLYMGLALAYGPTLGIQDGPIAAYLKDQYKQITGKDADKRIVRLMTSGLVGYLFPETDISRLQPYGQDFLLADFFDPDKGLDISTALGPAGALGHRFYDATIGSAKLWAFLGGKLEKEDLIPTTGDILHDLAKTASSYSRYDKARIAYQTGQYLTNKGDVLQEDLNTFDSAMIALGFPPLQSVEAFEANAYLNDWTKTAVKDARIVANYTRDAMKAPEGSSEERRNWAYAQFIIQRYAANDPTGEMTMFVQRQVDKNLRDMGAYNEKVFERLMRTLGKTERDLRR